MLSPIQRTPTESLSLAWRRVIPLRNELDAFRDGLIQLFKDLDPKETEENNKGFLKTFLEDIGYKGKNLIATRGRTDLVIHRGKTSNDPPVVLFEVKRASKGSDHKNEMISRDDFNRKAMHELIFYFIDEREKKNSSIKHLVITNVTEWFVFESSTFNRLFYNNSKLLTEFRERKEEGYVDKRTSHFYKKVNEVLAELTDDIPFTYFNLSDLKPHLEKAGRTQDRALTPFFKFLQPAHLIREPFGNDSNTLNRDFYSELLHLIGLEEVKQGGKKLIQRKSTPDPGSLIENTLTILETEEVLHKVSDRNRFGSTSKEQLYNIALALCITWVNRVLFLKLLEAQLVAYHSGNKDYRFLFYERIPQYDELYKLFFQVLAKKVEDRTAANKAKYGLIPYLNSSLFEISQLEDQTIKVNSLDDSATLPLFPGTKLRFDKEKPESQLPTLEYLFRFLDAYDFASEDHEEVKAERKTIINASVLGLIFEKINGYRDGSFYTPGFITMYMARETIRRALVQKFNEAEKWDCETFDDLVNYTAAIRKPEAILAANRVINSLRLCDPAVGSGHFLVSALNELIACKQELGLLADRHGIRFKDYELAVENDELIVLDVSGHEPELFRYRYHVKESQRLQETLFHEKQALIENCLFGVDLNPNSVRICRLRLWIELLKHAYYTPASEFKALETLPNIDINIKEGNSLISRFALDADLKQALKKSKWNIEAYRSAITDYHKATDKEQKRTFLKLIEDIKENFSTTFSTSIPEYKKLAKLRGELTNLVTTNIDLFGKKLKQKDLEMEARRFQLIIDKQEQIVEAIRNNVLYKDAFEWRFEFPEILNDEGDFVGFDAIIGNPPYIRIQDLQSNPEIVDYYKTIYKTGAKGNYDIYVLFIELGVNLLRTQGTLNFILPHKFMNANYGEETRNLLVDNKYLNGITHFGHSQIFEDATTYTCLLFLSKKQNDSFLYQRIDDVDVWKKEKGAFTALETESLSKRDWHLLEGAELALYRKLTTSIPKLEEVTNRIFQGLKTSADKIYIVECREQTDKQTKIFSPFSEKEYWLESNLLYTLIKGGDSKRYQILPTERLILYPYSLVDNRLLSEVEISEKYPLTWKYLLGHKEYLENREDGKMKGSKWYEYGRNQAIEVIHRPKIFTPDIAPFPSFSFDEIGTQFFTGGAAGGYGIVTKKNTNSYFVLGILNSSVSRWLISKTSTQMRGGYYSFESRFIKSLPIPKEDGKLSKKVIASVSQILKLKKSDPSTNTTELEAQIDQLIYQLYELTEEEIALVETD